MTTARDRLHIKYCPDLGACDAIGGAGERQQCQNIDYLLDLVEEQALHRGAEKLRADFEGRSFRSTVDPGLLFSADLIDPYLKVEAFDRELYEVHPSEAYSPDCPRCKEGVEHWHRKADNSLVRGMDA